MRSIDKANFIINYLKSINADPRTIAVSCDVNHLHKTYEIIKNNPKITEDVLLERIKCSLK